MKLKLIILILLILAGVATGIYYFSLKQAVPAEKSNTPTTNQTNGLPNTDIDEQTRQIIIKLAEEEIKKHKENYSEYVLQNIRPIKDKPNKYFVEYDRPSTSDAQIEMIIDAVTGEITNYRDEWA